MLDLIVLFAYAVLTAGALSLTQAWAASAQSSSYQGRYVLAWAVCTTVLPIPVFMALGFPGQFATAHSNVGWTAIPLSALTTAAAIGIGLWRWPPAMLHGLPLLTRLGRLFPIHLAAIIILGAVDLLILSVVFLGNIH